ncbi:MAG TPA: c-type cytochrome [Gemmatimonadales bacterium]|nr:c-type cytochrome [Gemmatimonadales bacterium]
MQLRTRLGLVFGLALAVQAGTGDSAAAQTAAPAGVTPEAVAKGDTIFHKTGLCYACHGNNAEGTVGPNLTDGEWIHGDGSLESIIATVAAGVPKEKAKNGIPMPPKGGSSISEEDVKAVSAYVYSLSHK